MVNENVEEWITIEENLFWRKKPQKQQCFGSENLWKTAAEIFQKTKVACRCFVKHSGIALLV